MNREELIKYIKGNDLHYDYSKVKFDFYTDEELQMIYNRIKREKASEKKVNESGTDD